jgi:mucin-6/19
MHTHRSMRRLRGTLGTAAVVVLLVAAFMWAGGIGPNAQSSVAKAGPSGSVSISSISVSSTCGEAGGFTGTVTLSGNATTTVTLGLFYHVPGTSTFQDSGLTDNVVFSNSNTAPYNFSSFTATNANTYRIQVVDSGGLGGATVKSNSVQPCTPTTTTTTTTSTTTSPSTTTTSTGTSSTTTV